MRVLLGSAAVVLAACSSTAPLIPGGGNPVTLTPQVGSFTSVSVGTAFSVTTSRGANPSVRITVPESAKDRVVARTEGSELQISLSTGPGIGSGPLEATIVVAEPLQGITAQQAAIVNAAAGSLDRDVTLRAGQASTVTVAVNASSLSVDAGQSSTVTVTGQTDTASIKASEASTFKGFDLQGRAVTVQAESASTIEVTATATLTGSASAASTVRYRGSPQTTVDKDVSSTVEAG